MKDSIEWIHECLDKYRKNKEITDCDTLIGFYGECFLKEHNYESVYDVFLENIKNKGWFSNLELLAGIKLSNYYNRDILKDLPIRCTTEELWRNEAFYYRKDGALTICILLEKEPVVTDGLKHNKLTAIEVSTGNIVKVSDLDIIAYKRSVLDNLPKIIHEFEKEYWNLLDKDTSRAKILEETIDVMKKYETKHFLRVVKS